jgi:hypothetical protein
MNWHEINEALREMGEEEVKTLLQHEKHRERPRPTYLIRLHQRYCALRDARERRELLTGLNV